MSLTVDSLPGGLLALSEEMRLLRANRALGDMVLRDPESLIGQPIDALLTAPARILFQTNVYPALRADGRVEEVYLTLAAADGTSIPVLLNAARTDGDGGGYHGIVLRISARARWETELLAATRALEQERAAGQQIAAELSITAGELEARYAEERRRQAFRDAFIGVVSHELRTPITTIFGMSHLLRNRYRTMDLDSLGDRLDDVHAESDRMLRLVEDLLVLSRAEGDRLDIELEPILLQHVVAAAVAGERGRSSGHTIDFQVRDGVPLALGEEVYVEQVIRNFLSNATKYSPPGSTVHVTVAGEHGGASVRVRDEGPGFGDIPPDQLFELFFRSPEAVRQTAGAGIGLFVCRELMNAMGGRAWAAAASPGAEFACWLPRAEVEIDDDEFDPSAPSGVATSSLPASFL